MLLMEVDRLSYQKYGISPELVERIKSRMKHNPAIQQRVTEMVKGLTRADLQDPVKVKNMMNRIARVLDIALTPTEARNIVRFVIDQKIDPNNTFHLIRLWGMFR